MAPDAEKAGIAGTDALRSAASGLVNAAAGALAEALVVGLYLIFMLWEVRRVPARIEAGFGVGRGARVLAVLGRINVAMTSYLRAKVVTSLITAVPTAIVVWAFGVKFPMLWGIAAFLGNSIPYVGGVVAVRKVARLMLRLGHKAPFITFEVPAYSAMNALPPASFAAAVTIAV